MSDYTFAAFILTHGRADRILTDRALRKSGYSGQIYYLVDNEDTSIEAYRERYGDAVIVFDKLAEAQEHDDFDNFNDRRVIVYARNATFRVARELGIDYFVQLDDDYQYFTWKFTPSFQRQVKDRHIQDLDGVLHAMVEFVRSTGVATLAMLQNGDFIGGELASLSRSIKLVRKAMNSFVCDARRPIGFLGRVNEDVTTYVLGGGRGQLLMSSNLVSLKHAPTQQRGGGMSDTYLAAGTYVKSFYTVMAAPSCVKVSQMGAVHRRYHHRISWRNAVPKILREEHRG